MTRRILSLALAAAAAATSIASGALSASLPEPQGQPAPLSYAADSDPGADGRRVLAEDPSGDGRMVEAVGDVDKAQDIAVVVPGVGQNLGNFRHSASHAGAVPLANARALHDEMRRHDPDRDIAVVAWLGYQPPQGVDGYAATSTRAEQGAEELVRFRGRLPADAHVTLACHSYGSTVCGRAARTDGVADDVVALASPGMGVDSAEEIDARVWAARAGNDWIRFVPSLSLGPLGLGDDPLDPDFGARTFPAGSTGGHDHYYRRGSATLSTTAHIALGGDAPENTRT